MEIVSFLEAMLTITAGLVPLSRRYKSALNSSSSL